MGCAFFPVEMLGTLGTGVLSGSKSNCFAAGIRLLYAAHGEAPETACYWNPSCTYPKVE